MRDVLFLIIISVSALIATVRPVYGILAFISLSLIGANSLTWTFGRTLPYAQIVAIGTLVGFVFWREPRVLPRQRELAILFALWLVYAASTMQADEPQRAFAQLILVSKILLMTGLSVVLIQTEKRLDLLFRVVTLSLGFYALKGGIFAVMTGGRYMVWGPEYSFLTGNNGVGLAMAMNAPLLFYASKSEEIPWIRWLQRSVFLLSYPAVIFTYSRGAWLGLAAVTLLIAIRSKYKFAMVGVLAVALALSPLALALAPTRLVERFNSLINYEQDGSAVSRFWNWRFCANAAIANPILGAGFDFYSKEAYVRYYPEFLMMYPNSVWSCHSTWLSVLAEHGALGFIVWVSLFISCLISARKIRLAKGNGGAVIKARNYALALEGSWLAYAVSGSFVDYTYFDLFYQLVAIVIILKQIYFRPAEVTESRVT
jgi:probable O-glycosylation ligase (exosortase A-associated)